MKKVDAVKKTAPVKAKSRAKPAVVRKVDRTEKPAPVGDGMEVLDGAISVVVKKAPGPAGRHPFTGRVRHG